MKYTSIIADDVPLDSSSDSDAPIENPTVYFETQLHKELKKAVISTDVQTF